MDLNATLLGQILTFTVFVWFTMKYVWPPIVSAMEERKKKIAEGLAAAERGHRDLELAQHRIAQQLRDVKAQASDILDQAHQRGVQIIEEAKNKAREESQRIVALAHTEIAQEHERIRQILRKETVELAISGAEKILESQIDSQQHAMMVKKLTAEIEG